MKRLLTLFFILLTVYALSIESFATEYSFDFTDGKMAAEKEIDDFINSLPEDIKEKVPEISTENANDTAEKYGFGFFAKEFASSVNKYIPSSLSLFSMICSMLIISAVVNNLSGMISSGSCEKAFVFCSSLCIILAVFTLRNGSYNLAVSMLSTLSNTMTLMVPVMEAIYISAGNTGLAAVTGTGMGVMLTAAEALYSKVLTPAITVSFVLACVAAVTDNKGLTFLSQSIRKVITTAVIFVMSMTSIILSMQTSLSASADKFSARAVRFALGSYIPLVGGAMSESLSAFTGSLSLLKQLAGTAGIVVIVLLILPPAMSLVMTRISIYISGVVAGMLGCDKPKALLDDIGGIYTMLISITLSASISFIYALSLFCKASLALA